MTRLEFRSNSVSFTFRLDGCLWNSVPPTLTFNIYIELYVVRSRHGSKDKWLLSKFQLLLKITFHQLGNNHTMDILLKAFQFSLLKTFDKAISNL